MTTKWITCKCGHEEEGIEAGSEDKICLGCACIGCWNDSGETCDECCEEIADCTCKPKEAQDANR